MYKFREIICYRCNHRFVHQEYSAYSTPSHYEYLKKDTQELLDYAICPNCSCGMVILEQTHIGADPDSADIIKVAFRGI